MRKDEINIRTKSSKVFAHAVKEKQSKEYSFANITKESKKNTIQDVVKMYSYFTLKQWIALFLIVIPLFFVGFKAFMIITSILVGVFMIIGIEFDKKEDKRFKA